MNREQAKIIGAMTDEQLEAIEKKCWIKNRQFIVAFGEGRTVMHACIAGERLSFKDATKLYSIAAPKITFNGVEIDAPIEDVNCGLSDVWTPSVKDKNSCVLAPEKWRAASATACYAIKERRAWATEEACQLYCDTHNKMMGIK